MIKKEWLSNDKEKYKVACGMWINMEHSYFSLSNSLNVLNTQFLGPSIIESSSSKSCDYEILFCFFPSFSFICVMAFSIIDPKFEYNSDYRFGIH